METNYTWDNNFCYEITETEAIITEVISIKETQIIIPDYVEHIPVTRIAKEAFSDKNGYNWNCSSLETLILPKHCKIIDNKCFYDGEIKRYILNDELEHIGEDVFGGDNYVEEIYIPSSLKTFGYQGNNFGSQGFSINGGKVTFISPIKIYITDLNSWMSITFDCPYKGTMRGCCDLYINDELIRDIAIPNEITEIKPFIFGYINLHSVFLHKNIKKISSSAFTRVEQIILEAIPTEDTEDTIELCQSLLDIKAQIICNGQDVTEIIRNKIPKKELTLDNMIENVLTNVFDRQGLFIVETFDKAGCGDKDLKKFNSLKKALLHCANELKRLESWNDSDRFTFYFNENGGRAEDKGCKYDYSCQITEL